MHPFIYVGSLVIPTYYLVISLTVCLCLFWLHLRLRDSELSQTTALDVSLVLMVGSFVGARLFHIIYENPEYYLQAPLKVFYFWDGGFVFYGGALLAGVLGYLFVRWKDPERIWQYFDLFSPILALSYSLGRIGCLLAGCCYGKTCELPWAIAGRHPTAVYATLWELGAVFILLGLSSEKDPAKKSPFLRPAGSLFFCWMILHGLGRLVMEAFRDDFRGAVFLISVSSWISLGLVVGGILCLILRSESKANPKAP